MLASSASPLRYALGGMAALAVAMGIGRFVYTPILPGMMEQLGLSATQSGLVASANYLGYLVGAIATAGAWAQGRERLLALCWLAASAALCALMAATDSFPLFLAIRFLGGVASAFVLVFASSIVFSQLSATGRGDLQAVHFGGVGMGIAASSAMMAVLISTDAGWRAGWIGAAILSVLGFAIAMRLIDRGPIVTGASAAEPSLPRDRPLVLMILAYGLFGFGYIITATFLIAIVRAGGSSRLFETMVWLATGLAALPSVFLWNVVARRGGVVVAFGIGCAVEAVGVAASVSLGGQFGPLLGGVLLGGTFVGLTALGLQAGRQLAPHSPRLVMALMTAAFGTGQILGPIAAGFAAEWTGDFVVASVGAALVLIVAGAVALISRAAPKSP
ncbi:YbfB/YjiJ family MFS transporter [Mesorhizobium sp. IMUNJ 23232]|uniref:YbfB/YjiJ family MFS transporter n=1 Tax=Mesorhizobium sp. IMUNJ 23232 TaxID=3376064 RepID=UPI003792839F